MHEVGGSSRAPTALFAALAAIVSLQAVSTVNEALVPKTEASVLQAKASGAWSYYQARGIKATIARSALEPWIAGGRQPSPSLAGEEERNLQSQREIKRQAQAFEQARDKKIGASR